MRARDLDWGKPVFIPAEVELCLNLEGFRLTVDDKGTRREFDAKTAGFYRPTGAPLKAQRNAGEKHEFLTVEYSNEFLARNLTEVHSTLHPIVRAAMDGKPYPSGPATPTRLTADQQQLVSTLRTPPVYAAAQPLWYRYKVLELAVTFFFLPPRRGRTLLAPAKIASRTTVWNRSSFF